MNQILTANGEYKSTSFAGPQATWRLIGSESDGGKPLTTLDTFTDGKGNYITKRRLDIYNWAEAGDIYLPGTKKAAA